MCGCHSLYMYGIYHDQEEFDSVPFIIPMCTFADCCRPPLYQTKQAHVSQHFLTGHVLLVTGSLSSPPTDPKVRILKSGFKTAVSVVPC